MADNSYDDVVENADEGLDLVRSKLNSYGLGANIENLTFIGTGKFAGFGNNLSNVTTGGDGADVLDGRGGADKMIGGLGDDVYYTDNVGDVVIEAAGGGNDRMLTTLATAKAADNVETLLYSGSGAFTGYANAARSFVFGGAGNDTLIGGARADFLGGMAGNDVLTGGGGADIFYFDGPGLGVDRITDFQLGLDHIELRRSTFGITSLADLSFVSSATPVVSDSRPTLLYNTATGALLFDPTGDDASDQIQIAVVTGKPIFAFADLIIA